MNSLNLNGNAIPIIAKSQVTGSPTAGFAAKNQRLESDMNTPGATDAPKKSELVEIQTPTARVLYKTIGVFPFDLVPDELIIDEIKVSVIYKGIFSRQVNNILIKDITDILYNSSFFLGAIRINGGEYQGVYAASANEKGPLTVSRLRKSEAQAARRIILGLMIFSDQKVDTSKMSIEEINQKTSELGRAKTEV